MVSELEVEAFVSINVFKSASPASSTLVVHSVEVITNVWWNQFILCFNFFKRGEGNYVGSNPIQLNNILNLDLSNVRPAKIYFFKSLGCFYEMLFSDIVFRL